MSYPSQYNCGESIYKKKFGLKRVINACTPASNLGGSLMPPEVIEAMNDAAKHWVDIYELLKKCGDTIAKLCGAEAAYITSGAAAGMALAAGACMTANDPKKVERVNMHGPEGLKNEIIIQTGEWFHYCPMYRVFGAKIVEVGPAYPYLPPELPPDYLTKIPSSSGPRIGGVRRFFNSPERIEAAISEKTAAIATAVTEFCIQEGTVPLEDLIRIGHKHKVPVILDAASALPPASNLKKFPAMGVDLTIFSGGKTILGPNDTGIILGSGPRGKELIEGCAMNSYPKAFVMGRGFKVSKEQIVGVTVALERYLRLGDSSRDIGEKELAKARWIYEQFIGFPNVRSELVEADETGQPVVRVWLHIDEEGLGKSIYDIINALKKGDPSVRVRNGGRKGMLSRWGIIRMIPRYLLDGEEKIVVRRLKEELTSAT